MPANAMQAGMPNAPMQFGASMQPAADPAQTSMSQMASQLFQNVMQYNMKRINAEQQQQTTASATSSTNSVAPSNLPSIQNATPSQMPATPAQASQSKAEVEDDDDEWLDCWGPKPGTREYKEQYGEGGEKPAAASAAPTAAAPPASAPPVAVAPSG